MEKLLEINSHYTITKEGRVYNTLYNKELKPYVSITTGYLYVTLRRPNGGRGPVVLHRLVGFLHLPNPENKPFINHKDGCKTNPHVDNLEWVTNKENCAHASENNLIRKLDQKPNNVNPVENIHHVCQLLEEGLLGNKEIGRLTGVNEKTVGQIKYRKQWKDISTLYNW